MDRLGRNGVAKQGGTNTADAAMAACPAGSGGGGGYILIICTTTNYYSGGGEFLGDSRDCTTEEHLES